jgi:hypothetical protein
MAPADSITGLSEDQLQVLCHVANAWDGVTDVDEATAHHLSHLGLATIDTHIVQTTALGQHLLAAELAERLDGKERFRLRRISNGGVRASRFAAQDVERLFAFRLISKSGRSLFATPLGKQCALLLEKSADIGSADRQARPAERPRPTAPAGR